MCWRTQASASTTRRFRRPALMGRPDVFRQSRRTAPRLICRYPRRHGSSPQPDDMSRLRTTCQCCVSHPLHSRLPRRSSHRIHSTARCRHRFRRHRFRRCHRHNRRRHTHSCRTRRRCNSDTRVPTSGNSAVPQARLSATNPSEAMLFPAGAPSSGYQPQSVFCS